MGVGVNSNSQDSSKQNDSLLWLAAAVVAGIGVTWLVISQPWSSPDQSPRVQTPAIAAPAVPAPTPTGPQPARDAQANLDSSFDQDPLRMAELAYDAGMLVEPEEYSAWALYRRVLQREPDNATARQGLEKIAEELLRRANSAVEQGRFDDARVTLERIRSAIPVHPGANDLAFRIDELAPRPILRSEPIQASTEAVIEQDEEPASELDSEADSAQAAVQEEPEKDVDPVIAPHEAFTAALAQNRLLTPVDGSAKHYLNVLSSLNAEHELTRQARAQLFSEFLSRADQAAATDDTEAAMTWIDEADTLGVDPIAVGGARQSLRSRLIEIESARRVPASALTIVEYQPPSYPNRALTRALDGWVDIEFTVARDGSTQDIVVTDASHNTYFRDEASEAVETWRFEPRVFMDEPIEQRAYTRIRFAVE